MGKSPSPLSLPPALRLALPLVLVTVALWLWQSSRQVENGALPLPAPPRFDLQQASRPAPGEPLLDLDGVAVPQPFRLRRGETLGGLLMDFGLEPPEAYAAVETLGELVDVRKLRAGEGGLAFFDADGALANVALNLSGKGRAELTRSGSGWTSSWREFERRVSQRAVAGELDGFLEESIAEAGGRRVLAYAMADVLQWDLDFNRDLRLGDRFEAFYEEVHLEGDFHDLGQILALVYENGGRRLEAYRYGGGYYDAEGRPLQKMFLRSPMRFTRVTSRFSHRRFHPILKKHRPHYGVDYGAPRGTPVRVTASGTVTFAGRNGGAGNMVRVRHPNGFETSYLHLSGFGPGVRRGQRVSQGDTIGYVGSTGLSTGPHLDYRVKKDGRWVDPLKLRSEPAEPVPPQEMEAFLAERDRFRQELDGVPARRGRTVVRGSA